MNVDEHKTDTNVTPWLHDLAAALHGWPEHEVAEGDPMTISRADYEAALVAVAKAPADRVAHPAALSEHAS